MTAPTVKYLRVRHHRARARLKHRLLRLRSIWWVTESLPLLHLHKLAHHHDVRPRNARFQKILVSGMTMSTCATTTAHKMGRSDVSRWHLLADDIKTAHPLPKSVSPPGHCTSGIPSFTRAPMGPLAAWQNSPFTTAPRRRVFVRGTYSHS